MTPPAEKKYVESREKARRPQHVVNFAERDDKHVVKKIKQQRVENNSMIFPPQVLYYNLEMQLCQVLSAIKSALKI